MAAKARQTTGKAAQRSRSNTQNRNSNTCRKKSSKNNRKNKSKLHKHQHKEHQTAAKAASKRSSENSSKSSTNNKRSNTNIWSKAARVGWVFQRTTTPKQRQKQQQRQQQQQEAAAAKATRTGGKTAHSKKSQHQAAAKNGKQHTKQQKQYKHFGRSKTAKVCFSHNNSSKEARMQGAKTRKIKAKRCGVPKGGWVWERGGRGRRGRASSRGNSVGYQQFFLQLVEVKGVPVNCQKMLLTFWKVKHCKGGRRVSTVGGSKATTNKSSSKSRKKQQQAATRTQASGISVLFVAFFFLDTTKFVIIGHRLSRKSRRRANQINWQINCKIVLDILEKLRGFTRQSVSPNVHI